MSNFSPKDRYHSLLSCLHHLPRKVATNQHVDSLTALVLLDLCHHSKFNLQKAAYFIDNPDFNILRGVAGFDHEHHHQEPDAQWSCPDDFHSHLCSSQFHNQIRAIERESIKRQQANEAEFLARLGQSVGIQNPHHIALNLKHDNYGYLLYQAPQDHDAELQEFLTNSAYILAFCPTL